MRGIDRVLIERLGLVERHDRKLLKVVMRQIVRRRRYLEALAADGAQRHDLDGNRSKRSAPNTATGRGHGSTNWLHSGPSSRPTDQSRSRGRSRTGPTSTPHQ